MENEADDSAPPDPEFVPKIVNANHFCLTGGNNTKSEEESSPELVRGGTPLYRLQSSPYLSPYLTEESSDSDDCIIGEGFKIELQR